MREVTPISNYKLRLFGEELAVRYSDCDGHACAELPTDEIYIYPNPDPDVFLSVRADPTVASPLTLALAAGHHLLCVRGLPLDEATFDVGGSAVNVIATRDGRFGVPIRIRHPIQRRTCVLYSAELPSSVYPTPLGNILLLRCECSEHFRESALLSIYAEICTEVAGCVAFSYADGTITARAYSPIFRPERSVPELAELLCSYALTELRLYGTPPRIAFSDVSVSVVAAEGRLLICPDR